MNRIKLISILGSLLIILLLILAGCSGDSAPSTSPPTDTPPSSGYTPPTDYPLLTEPIEPGVIPDNVREGGTPAISPAVVEIGNFHAGANAEWHLTIYNGTDEKATFAITYRIPDNTRTGYVTATNLQQHWITIESPMVDVDSLSAVDLLIILTMPASAQAPSSQWEFWISVIDQSQSGFVQTEMASRILINMQPE